MTSQADAFREQFVQMLESATARLEPFNVRLLGQLGATARPEDVIAQCIREINGQACNPLSDDVVVATVCILEVAAIVRQERNESDQSTA